MVSEFTLTGSSKEFRFPVVGVRSYSSWPPLSSEPSPILFFSTLLHPTGSSSLCLARSLLMGPTALVKYHEEIKSPINFLLAKIKCQRKPNISGGKMEYEHYWVGELSST